MSDSTVPVVFNFNEPGVSDGAECTVTLVVSCTCNCHTVKYDCV